jgi:CubicO group peptidase (beta-lactamase class C family)
VERVLDQDLATVVDERFARPLGLDDTSRRRHDDADPSCWFAPDGGPDSAVDFLALSHEAIDSFNRASRNMLSSTEDMLDWGEALYSGEVLGEETTTTMPEMRNSSSPRRHYGLGAGGYCLDEAGCSPDNVELVGHLGGFAASESTVAPTGRAAPPSRCGST